MEHILYRRGQVGECSQTALNGGVQDDSGGEEDAEDRADDVMVEAEIGGALYGLQGEVEISSKWSRSAFG